jgi:two-component system, OmpR family, response regulator
MAIYSDIRGARAAGRIIDAQPDRVTMRLLIIEDDRDAADYLIKAFREVGHVADAATNGEDGLAMALDGEYDVLIVDRMLPKRDGLSVIVTLRERGIETPALILSALGQVDDRVKGLRAGGDDYLPKPYSFSELLARVEVLSRPPRGTSMSFHSIATSSMPARRSTFMPPPASRA